MIGGELRGRPFGLHTSGQTPKVFKVPTWQHFLALLALLAPRVWPLKKSLGASKMETQTLVERSNFFSIKYSESDKRICNEFLSSPLERSLGFGFSVRPAKCEEAISVGYSESGYGCS